MNNKHEGLALADDRSSMMISITFQLSEPHARLLRKWVNGDGGMQSFLRQLQNKLNEDNTITLNNDEFNRLKLYTYKYGMVCSMTLEQVAFNKD